MGKKKKRKIYMLNNAFLCYTEISIYIQEICYECLNIYYIGKPRGEQCGHLNLHFHRKKKTNKLMQYSFARQTNCVRKSCRTHRTLAALSPLLFAFLFLPYIKYINIYMNIYLFSSLANKCFQTL